ncbi:MAG: hypothetical protein LBM02_03665, partial [Lachnospiraceae bacterium]|nr:hypothetical protein [Lachnospiraceae bacterium]
GTTATVASYLNNDNKPIFLEVKPKDMKTLISQNDEQKTQISVIFMSFASRVKNMYWSVYKTLSGNSIEKSPMINGSMAWLSPSELDHMIKIDSDSYKVNLKWGNMKSNYIWTERYLTQLLMHLAYTVTRGRSNAISWRFSYPTAFKNVSQFMDVIRNILDYEIESTGIKNAEIRFTTESIAAAMYVRNKIQCNTPVIVCVDIGGGTTDISFWVYNKFTYQQSVKFASREIFLEFFIETLSTRIDLSGTNLENVRIFFEKVGAQKKYDRSDKELALFEALLFEPEEMKKLSSKIIGSTNVEYFFKSIKLGFSTLAYYITLLISLLYQSSKILLNPRNDVEIFFVGNGAKIMNWFQPDGVSDGFIEELAFQMNNLSNRLLTKKARPINVNIEMHNYSLASKCEVSEGMLLMESKDFAIDKDFEQNIDSENLDDFLKTFNQMINSNDPETTDIDNPQFTLLEEFWRFYTGKQNNVLPDKIRRYVERNIYGAMKKHGNDDETMLPLILMELKLILESKYYLDDDSIS